MVNRKAKTAKANGWRVDFHFEMQGIGNRAYKDPAAPVNGWGTLAETPGLGLEPR